MLELNGKVHGPVLVPVPSALGIKDEKKGSDQRRNHQLLGGELTTMGEPFGSGSERCLSWVLPLFGSLRDQTGYVKYV